jgi:septum formation protein
MNTPQILLASSSPYRRELLQKLHLPFSWASPDIDETPYPEESPQALTLRLAEQKAKALADKHPEHLIIGSDQVTTLDGIIIGKPGTHSAAVEQLQKCRSRSLVFLTSLCLLNTKTGRNQISLETYKVSFRNLSDQQIDRYLRLEQPYDCAGSFKAEGLGISLFDKLEGEDPNTLIGLPLIALIRMLNNEGIDPLTA